MSVRVGVALLALLVGVALASSSSSSSDSSSSSSSSSSSTVHMGTPPPEVRKKIENALQAKLDKIADRRAEAEIERRKAHMASVDHLHCDPRRELHWLFASINGRFWDDVQDMYRSNAKRHDDGMVLQLSKGKSWTAAQWRCVDSVVPNFEVEVVSLGHGDHNVGSAHMVVKYGQPAGEHELPMLVFFEFDHLCKIAHEHYYWDPRPQETQQALGSLANCFKN